MVAGGGAEEEAKPAKAREHEPSDLTEQVKLHNKYSDEVVKQTSVAEQVSEEFGEEIKQTNATEVESEVEVEHTNMTEQKSDEDVKQANVDDDLSKQRSGIVHDTEQRSLEQINSMFGPHIERIKGNIAVLDGSATSLSDRGCEEFGRLRETLTKQCEEVENMHGDLVDISYHVLHAIRGSERVKACGIEWENELSAVLNSIQSITL